MSLINVNQATSNKRLEFIEFLHTINIQEAFSVKWEGRDIKDLGEVREKVVGGDGTEREREGERLHHILTDLCI